MPITVSQPVVVTGETITYDKVVIDSLNVSVERSEGMRVVVNLHFRLYGINSQGKKVFEDNQRSITIPDYLAWAAEQAATGDNEANQRVNQANLWVRYLIQKLGNLGTVVNT